MVSNQKIYLCCVKTGLLVFFIAIVFGRQNAFAQKYVTQSNADSSVVITKDSRLDDLVNKQKELNLQKQTIPGYRVQIYFGTMRQKAIELKNEFNSLHPQMASYLTYKQPNFKVRVGDFRTRLEAQKFLKDIQGKYSTSFIVTDDIRLPMMK
jgi:hypothetical protein